MFTKATGHKMFLMYKRFVCLPPCPSPTTKATKGCMGEDLSGSVGLSLIFSIALCQTKQKRKVCTGRRGTVVHAVVWKDPSLPKWGFWGKSCRTPGCRSHCGGRVGCSLFRCSPQWCFQLIPGSAPSLSVLIRHGQVQETKVKRKHLPFVMH